MDLTREFEDRIAIRALIDAYAHCADRRDAEGQMALFAPDAEFVVHMDARDPTPTQVIRGREGLRPVFEALRRYEATTHFNGQSTIQIDGERATGESYCLAHHVDSQHGARALMVAALRYLDVLEKRDGRWCFARRQLLVDWMETRPLLPPAGG